MDWQYYAWCVVGVVVGLAVFYLFDVVRQKMLIAELTAAAKAGTLPETSLEEPVNGVISITEDGFSVWKGPEQLADVKWDDISEIRAYKVDRWATDRICWGFLRSGRDDLIEVHEEMFGFEKLQKVAEARYGVSLADWWSEVAFPAFATNMTVIWPKQERSE